ncbi:hypothetical protein [Nonomuraea sp. PA05]|uniref:hypothetical protein n=1 Tax=Nonomuraea sp. PA05 TaxID=2604466 RepID=UPI001651CFCB|nr:hypothetical protein [Nonomuraea sp. PA05]
MLRRTARTSSWSVDSRLSETLGHVIARRIPKLVVVGLGPDHAEARLITAGRHGAHLEVSGSAWSSTWSELGTGLPKNPAICRFVLAGGVGDVPDGVLNAAAHANALFDRLDETYGLTEGSGASVVLVLELTHWPLLDRVAEELRKRRTPVAVRRGQRLGEVVGEVTGRSPSPERYSLVLVRFEGDRVSLVTRTLFEAGRIPGEDALARLTVRAPLVTDGEVSLPVVQGTAGPPESWKLVGGGLLPLAKGGHADLRAVLDDVSQVRLRCRDEDVPPDFRSWSELYETYLAWKHRPPAADLLFLVELNTELDETWHDRRKLIHGVIAQAGRALTAPGLLRIGLIGYRDHGRDTLYDSRNLLSTVPFGDPGDAVARLDSWQRGRRPHPTTAAMSDALYEASRLTWRTESVRFMVTLGDRMPCAIDQFSKSPPEGCPKRRSWRDELSRIKQRGVTCLAVVGKGEKKDKGRSWQALGEHGRFEAGEVTVDQLVRNMGLGGDFPFAQEGAGR